MRKLILVFALCFSAITYAHTYGQVVTILNSGVVTQGAGIAAPPPSSRVSRDAYAIACTTTGTGAISSTVLVQGYNTLTDIPITLATLNVSGTTSATAGTSGNAPWFYISANQTAISASSNTVCTLGE